MTDAATRSRPQSIPAQSATQIERALAHAVEQRWASRIWDRDTSVWTADDKVAGLIANRLGWLDLPAAFLERVEVLEAFAAGVRADGFTNALVCGMGGSSLAPAVMASSLAQEQTGMSVGVLDSTDPEAVRAATEASDPRSTLYLIASKSGTTTESLAFLAHFWHVEDELHDDIPSGLVGEHFVAITDPPPSLSAFPHNDLYREVFLNPADVGGRYSALSYVGLVPGALMGLDLRALLGDAAATAARCQANSDENPGLWLGVALGALAREGRDKLTLVIEPRFAALGSWIEQLVAESTGKHGVGVVPVDGEALGDPSVYDDDRVFVRIATGADPVWESATDRALAALADAGHPVMYLSMLGGDGALGGEFFRWEFATAVCGAVLGINPFDEPNVTESKDNTRRVLDGYRRDGALPHDESLSQAGRLTLVGDAPLRLTAGHDGLANELRRHLARTKPRGYVALQAYLAPTAERERALRDIATLIRDRSRHAVTVGFGPRFLHSTGQLHKGGPSTGCFVQLTAAHVDDLPIPGSHESFGTLIDAQAAGDFISLESHDLPVARVNLGDDPDAGLAELLALLSRPVGEPLSR